MHPRERLRLTTHPKLYDIDRQPSVAETTTNEISDLDIGLPLDPVAQHRAEKFIRAAIAFQMKQLEKAEAARVSQPTRIEIAAAELNISVEIAAEIVREIRRLTKPIQGVCFVTKQTPAGTVPRPDARTPAP